MLPTLFSFGDSFTVGQGLSKEDPSPTEAHPNCWSNVLANTLGLESINQAYCGASNKQIWHTVVNTKFQKNDLVLIAWSVPDRHCLIREYHFEQYPVKNFKAHNNFEIVETNWVYPLGIWHLEKDNDTKAHAFYKELYTDTDGLLSTFRYMCLCQEYVERSGAKIVHLGIPYVTPYEYIMGRTTGNWESFISDVTTDLKGKEPSFWPHWASHIKIPFTMTESIRHHGTTGDGHMSLKAGFYFASQVEEYLKSNNLID